MDCELSLVPISLSFPTRRPLKSVRRSGRSHDKGCENHSEQAHVGAVFTSRPRTPFFCPLESRIGSPQVPSFHSGRGTQMSTRGRASRDCKALHAMPDRPARPFGSPLGTRGEAPSKGTLSAQKQAVLVSAAAQQGAVTPTTDQRLPRKTALGDTQEALRG